MNTLAKKQQYDSPQIRRINLDNEISLILVSNNPGDPFTESNTTAPEYFNQQPVKDIAG
jgi:hypothetical protein